MYSTFKPYSISFKISDNPFVDGSLRNIKRNEGKSLPGNAWSLFDNRNIENAHASVPRAHACMHTHIHHTHTVVRWLIRQFLATS